MSRNTTEAAIRLMHADDEELAGIIRHDPDMVRDVAAALLHIRGVMLDANAMLDDAIASSIHPKEGE